MKQVGIGLALSIFLLSYSASSVSAEEPLQQDRQRSEKELEYSMPVAKSKEEYSSYSAIVALQSTEEILAQSQVFLEKYPNSALRFPVYQNLVSSLLRQQSYDQAFEWGKKALSEYPDHLMVMVPLCTVASNQLLMGNKAFAQDGEMLARKAVEFLNIGRPPQGYTPDRWMAISNDIRSEVYQSLGVFCLLSDKNEEAAQMLGQAAAYRTYDPYLLYLLAKAEYKLYQSGVRKPVEFAIDSGNESRAKPATLLEQIVNTYAKAIVLAEGSQQKALRAAIDYDVQMLTKTVPAAKTELARSMETARTEFNMVAKPPAAAADRP